MFSLAADLFKSIVKVFAGGVFFGILGFISMFILIPVGIIALLLICFKISQWVVGA